MCFCFLVFSFSFVVEIFDTTSSLVILSVCRNSLRTALRGLCVEYVLCNIVALMSVKRLNISTALCRAALGCVVLS